MAVQTVGYITIMLCDACQTFSLYLAVNNIGVSAASVGESLGHHSTVPTLTPAMYNVYISHMIILCIHVFDYSGHVYYKWFIMILSIMIMYEDRENLKIC